MKQSVLFLCFAALVVSAFRTPAGAQFCCAKITATPDSINFGSVPVGNSAQEDFRLLYTVDDNDSTALVTLTSDNSQFTVLPQSLTLGEDQPVTIQVTFTPSGLGVTSGVITVTWTKDESSTIAERVTVSGTGVSAISVNPTSLTFPDTLMGVTSEPLIFRITVAGGAAPNGLTLSSSNPDVFSVEPTFIADTANGGTFTVQVRFRPNRADLEPIRGSITVSTGVQNASVALQGRGLAFLLSESELDLGPGLVGCSAAGSYDIIPGGFFRFINAPLTAGFTADPADITTDERTTVIARYMPTEAGPAEGTIRVLARTTGQTSVLVVQTEDLPVTALGVQSSVSPDAVDFGEAPLGSPPVLQVIQVALAPQAETRMVLAAMSNNAAFTVESVNNATGEITVGFSPQSEGPMEGTLSVEAALPGDPNCTVAHSVALSGTGGPGLISLNPAGPIDFGTVAIGSQASVPIQVSNASNIDFAGSFEIDNPAFQIALNGVAQTGFPLPAEQSTTLELIFRPQSPQPEAGTLELVFMSAGSTQQPITIARRVPLAGEGIVPAFTFQVRSPVGEEPIASGGTIEFSRTPIAGASQNELLVRNEGTSSAVVESVALSAESIGIAEISPPLPASLQPGEAVVVTLNFQPTAPRLFEGTLTVDASQFSLQGLGILRGAQISGLGATVEPLGQPRVGVVLSDATPVALTGELELRTIIEQGRPVGNAVSLELGPCSAPGQCSAPFTVPAGSDRAVFSNGADSLGFAAGTVAAGFEFLASFENQGLDVSPEEAVIAVTNLNPAPPVLTEVTIVDRTPTSFTVQARGFTTTRQATSANFTFTPRAGVDLSPRTVSVEGTGAAFQNWFGNEASVPSGGMFVWRQPFTISGEPNAVQSVSVTLTNSAGNSAAQTVNVQ